jgi:hypothetical protein
MRPESAGFQTVKLGLTACINLNFQVLMPWLFTRDYGYGRVNSILLEKGKFVTFERLTVVP